MLLLAEAQADESQAGMEGRELCFLSFEGPHKPTERQLDKEALIKFSIL